MLLQNARLILRDRIQPGSVRISEGKIAAVLPADTQARGAAGTADLASVTRHSTLNPQTSPHPGEDVVDLRGAFLAPGFIDLHIHGAIRRDSMDADAESWSDICRYHAEGGTTALALTTVCATAEEIQSVLDLAGEFESPSDGARLLGIHIEGPYFSPEKPGAHRPELIRHPNPGEYRRWLAHPERITQMTLAPELPGALELIDALREAGIRVSGGHSDAWDDEAAAGFAHGMRQATHTFNCMSTMRRRGPYRVAGLLEFAMSEPEMLCELIADGRHVFPTLMRMLYHAKGADGIALVTDAAAGAGLEEGTHFQLGKIAGIVRDEVAVTADGHALCSSTATMMRCVRNMVQLVGAPLHEAVQMATSNPARALRLDARKGTLMAGADADLVAFDDDFTVLRTIIDGRTTYAA